MWLVPLKEGKQSRQDMGEDGLLGTKAPWGDYIIIIPSIKTELLAVAVAGIGIRRK